MSDPRHWLYRPDNWPKLWKWGGALLVLSVVAEFFVELHPGFGFAEWFSFNAIFGFLSCLVMVIFSKWLGAWIKRPQDYYDPSEDPEALAAESNPQRSASHLETDSNHSQNGDQP